MSLRCVNGGLPSTSDGPIFEPALKPLALADSIRWRACILCLQFTAPLQSGLYAMCLVLIATARETATYVRGRQLHIFLPHFPLSRNV